MNIKNHLPLFLLMGFSFCLYLGCKVPYDPPIKNSKDHFLVVEGYLNGSGQTIINLSRTRNITWGDTASLIHETGARMEIEDNNNNIFPLYEAGNGAYTGYFYGSPGNQYRLHIKTADGKEYRSEYVPFKQSPPMDKLGWKMLNSGVHIYVNTHDPQKNSVYYQWKYDETWEFHSQYYSTWKYRPDDTTVIPRTFPVYQCWRYNNSSSILLGSSAKLKEDVINDGTIVNIPDHDKRISVLYSILVTQYVLDSSAYNFWNAMKSNTENVGSIFDPQPNMTRGNIHCLSDSSELVIGYIGAGNTVQQRLFISNSELPNDWNLIPNCTEYTVPKIRDSMVYYFSGNSLIPYDYDSVRKNYPSASGTCVDCTLTGSPVKPAYWP